MRRPTSTDLGALALSALFASQAAPAMGGEIHGRISVGGALPPRPVADRTLDPACGPSNPDDDPLLVSSTGGVQNAVVRVLGVAPARAKATAASLPPVVVEQKGCSYIPRVQAALAGQAVAIENRDPLLHNLHAFAGSKGLFNIAQPAGSTPVRRDLSEVEVLRLKCDIHPWMFGWVVFNQNPFFAVTGPDGRFTLRGVPPGTYQLAVWHELLGTRLVSVKVAGTPVTVEVRLGEPPGDGR